VTVKVVGEIDNEKFFTVNVRVVVRVSVPLVPVTVMVYVPPATVAGVTNVKVLVPEPVIEAGLKLAVAFVGKPLADSVVAPVRPEVAAKVMVAVPFAPAAVTVTLPGLDSVNPGVTVRLAEVV
jgi:hypothetical protein